MWLASIHAGPRVADGIQEGYGVVVDQEQLARWTVYHIAMQLVYEAEQLMFDAGTDSYEDTVDQLYGRRASRLKVSCQFPVETIPKYRCFSATFA